MFSFLDPRLWIAVVLAIVLSSGASYFKGRHDGRLLERADTAASVAQANHEAHKNEQLRQDRVDEAAKSAAARDRRLLADAANARADVDGLRNTLDAVERASADSLATANKTIRVTSGLLATCADRYIGVAEDATRADSEARELRQGWPK